jgi:ATP-dependent DNA ligase
VQPEQEPIISVAKRQRRGSDADESLESLVREVIEIEGETSDEPVLIETRCVILGYTVTDTGELNSLVLGSAPKGRLAYVGLLSQPDIPEEERPDVLLALEELDGLKECHVKQGVPIKHAKWVEPKLMCKVEHTSWTTQYRLQKPTFVKLVLPEDEEKEKLKKEKAEESKRKAEEALKAIKDELQK